LHQLLFHVIQHGDQELYEELLAIEIGSDTSGRLLLPPKEITKKTLGRSPNVFDNLILTFAFPVHRRKPKNANKKPYNPMKPLGS